MSTEIDSPETPGRNMISRRAAVKTALGALIVGGGVGTGIVAAAHSGEATPPRPAAPSHAYPTAAPSTTSGRATQPCGLRRRRHRDRQETLRLGGLQLPLHRHTALLGRRAATGETTVIYTVSGGDQDQVGNISIDSTGLATFDRETRPRGPTERCSGQPSPRSCRSGRSETQFTGISATGAPRGVRSPGTSPYSRLNPGGSQQERLLRRRWSAGRPPTLRLRALVSGRPEHTRPAARARRGGPSRESGQEWRSS